MEPVKEYFFKAIEKTGIKFFAAKYAESIAKGEHIKQIEGEKTRQAVAVEQMKPLAELIKSAEMGELDMTNPEHLATYFEHEEKIEKLRKDANLTSIFLLDHDEVPEEQIEEENLDADWFSKFVNFAQDISDQDMQSLWAKILSEEIQNPNSVSFRAMAILFSISKSD